MCSGVKPPAPGFRGGERDFLFVQGREIIPHVGPRSVRVRFYFIVLNFLLPEHVLLNHFLNKKLGFRIVGDNDANFSADGLLTVNLEGKLFDVLVVCPGGMEFFLFLRTFYGGHFCPFCVHVGQGCFDFLVNKTNILFVKHGGVLCIYMRNDHFYAAFIDGLLGFVGNVVYSEGFSSDLIFLFGCV